MGLPWIELHTNLPRHPKSLALGLALANPMAWGHVAALWLWCAENRPDGRFFGDVASAMVESAALWMGKAGEFTAAAVKAGFLEKTEDGYWARSWSKRAAAHVAKQERDRSRQRDRYARTSKRFTEKPKSSQKPRAENARRTRRDRVDLSGNSNTNTNTNPDLFPSETAEPSAPEPRKQSPQQQFFAWAQECRVETLRARGVSCESETAWDVKRVNTQLGFVRDKPPDVLQESYALFLEDERRAGLDPPWALGSFVKHRDEYESKARRKAVG